MAIIFVDKITLSSLLRVALCRPSNTVRYFEPISTFNQSLVTTFRAFRLIREEVRPIEYWIGQAQIDQQTGAWNRDKQQQSIVITSHIIEHEIGDNSLVQLVCKRWPKSKILHYFRQLIQPIIHYRCMQIALASWTGKTQETRCNHPIILVINQNRWLSYLYGYSRAQDVELVTYRNLWGPASMIRSLARTGRTFRKRIPQVSGLIPKLVHILSRRGHKEHKKSNLISTNEQPNFAIGIKNQFNKLSSDQADRTELFWLAEAPTTYDDIVVYDYSGPFESVPETQDFLKESGIRVFGWGSGVPKWNPTSNALRTFLRLAFSFAMANIQGVCRRKLPSAYYFKTLITLFRDYSYWRDFFSANGIVINVTTSVDTGIPPILALDDLSGVSIAYQYSVSLDYPAASLSNGEDVQLLFSSSFEPFYRSTGGPIGSYIETGFVYDSALIYLKNDNNLNPPQRKLKVDGVDFVLGYFDEYSIDRWSSPFSSQNFCEDYEFLFKWLLDDPSIAMVFKPKRSQMLLQRLSRISDLMDDALQTGRCRFLLSDYHSGNIYPSQAALMSDMCVGLLSSPTAGLEARLSGTPTVLVDTRLEPNHPILSWGTGSVVFKDWHSIRKAVELYRKVPTSSGNFGDWSDGLSSLEGFSDGGGTIRMGQVIHWIHSELKKGASKNAAIRTAELNFSDAWGDGHVSHGLSENSAA